MRPSAPCEGDAGPDVCLSKSESSPPTRAEGEDGTAADYPWSLTNICIHAHAHARIATYMPLHRHVHPRRGQGYCPLSPRPHSSVLHPLPFAHPLKEGPVGRGGQGVGLRDHRAQVSHPQKATE